MTVNKQNWGKPYPKATAESAFIYDTLNFSNELLG